MILIQALLLLGPLLLLLILLSPPLLLLLLLLLFLELWPLPNFFHLMLPLLLKFV